MPTTYYHTVNGSIIGETTSGVRTDYMTDALGSVTGTTISGTVQNTYRYMPFGGILSQTGSAPSPRFLWVGGQGYRATQIASADYYVRKRHLSVAAGAWTSLDFYWLAELAWVYANNNPTTASDRTGMLAATPVDPKNWSVSCCSGYKTFINWTGIPAGYNGFLIQNIIPSGEWYTSCCPNSAPVQQPLKPYFEAWPIIDGVIDDCDGPTSWDDEWSWGQEGPMGNLSMSGTAILVAGTPDGYVGNFISYGAEGAGCLESTNTWSFWFAYFFSATFLHQTTTQNLTYDWDCCCNCSPTGPLPCETTFQRMPTTTFNAINDCPCSHQTCGLP